MAAAKLIAAKPEVLEEIASTSVLLNLLLHLALVRRALADRRQVEIWFQIENESVFVSASRRWTFRSSASTWHADREGGPRLYRLGLSDLAYALTKLLGIVLIVAFGVSLEKALIVNIAAFGNRAPHLVHPIGFPRSHALAQACARRSSPSRHLWPFIQYQQLVFVFRHLGGSR